MSHIPSSAMPHAGPAPHDDPAPAAPPPRRQPPSSAPGGWTLAAIALGGALTLGAIAVAVPLLRTPPRPKPKPKRKDRRKARG